MTPEIATESHRSWANDSVRWLGKEGPVEDTVPELLSQEHRRAFQETTLACAKALRRKKHGMLGK